MHQPTVILAASRKHNGLCLAGKRLGAGKAEWVRPVSDFPGQAWPQFSLARYLGRLPRIGDRIYLPLAARAPEGYQRENVLVRRAPWQSAGSVEVGEIVCLVDEPESLWLNGWHSIHGWNDRMPVDMASVRCATSLTLIRPQALRFCLSMRDSRLAVRAEFEYGGAAYNLSVTDERACARWIERLADGDDGHADALLCISVGMPFHDYCYKLVASVIELDHKGV